jgi:hypothetical protein
MLGAILPQAGKRYDSAMKFRAAVLAVGLVVAHAADAPRSADSLMERAKAEAAQTHRAIWLMFDASW